jgi:hypothetical protein
MPHHVEVGEIPELTLAPETDVFIDLFLTPRGSADGKGRVIRVRHLMFDLATSEGIVVVAGYVPVEIRGARIHRKQVRETWSSVT